MKTHLKQFYGCLFCILLTFYFTAALGQPPADTLTFMGLKIQTLGNSKLAVKKIEGREFLIVNNIGITGNDGFVVFPASQGYFDTEIVYRDPINLDAADFSVYQMTNYVLKAGKLYLYSECSYRRWSPGQVEVANYYDVSTGKDTVKAEVQLERVLFDVFQGEEGVIGHLQKDPKNERPIAEIKMSIDRHSGDGYEFYHPDNFNFLSTTGNALQGNGLILYSREAELNRPVSIIEPVGVFVNIGNIGVDSVIIQSIKESPSRKPLVDIDPALIKIEVKNIIVFPNPATSVINICLKEREALNGFIEVFREKGTVFKRRVEDVRMVSIGISHLEPGPYFVRFISSNGRATAPVRWIKL